MILPKSDAKDFLDYFKWYSEQKSANENLQLSHHYSST